METATREKRKLSDLTFDQLAIARNTLSGQIKATDDEVSALKAKREKVDVEFLRRFNEQGVQNVRTKHGTPHIIKRESYSVADKDTFMTWVRDNSALDFLEVRVAKQMVEAYKEQNASIPPGVNYSAKLTIGMTK